MHLLSGVLQPGRPSPGAPQRSPPAAAAPAGLLGARCLQALVVLPTRGLAVQVHEVLQPLCRAVGLDCGLAAAQGNLAQEEGGLGQQGMGEEGWQQQGAGGVGEGERSSVEVLVATPGRLVAHLQHTPGFTLSHLRFLVSSSRPPIHIAPSGMVVKEG
ncbi:DEAD-box ATP-dependent RNA helicase [Haematococcus lacustris]|uniref:DEAD-box ATP-dependent RNA helicase n=1 Tax=Haematococcus lacustris TaxID=44745 RepID=A0A699ZSC1_HAELA|nr:DEAD-box ATP-dependent RNA helicase [Haematococcus lacustris]